MATVTERIDGTSIEVKLPGLFSRMKVSFDGRELGVGAKSAKRTQSCSVEYYGAEFVVTLVEKTVPAGFDLTIARNGAVVVSRMVSRSGKEIDARLGGIPKWMFAFPILAGAPIVLHGLIPGAIGGAGAALGYKIVATHRNDRRKLLTFGILNIVATWTLIWFVVVGFAMGMVKMGWLRHNEEYLESTVEKTNVDLPMQVDEYTTLTHSRYVDDTLILSYTIASLDPASIDFDTLKSQLQPSTCGDEVMSEIIRNGYWLRYEYVADGSAFGKVDISEADCDP